MPLPSRNTSAGRPAVPDTALLSYSFSPPSTKETRSNVFALMVALQGRYIAVTLAAADDSPNKISLDRLSAA
jgi:hypothetical protein